MHQVAKYIIIYFVLIIVSEGVYIPKKCNVKDTDCKKEMYGIIFKNAMDGDPSVSIPKSDPMNLSSTTSALPNSVKLILNEGIATGLKNCNIDHWTTALRGPMYTTINITCTTEINGKYTVEMPRSVLLGINGIDTGADVITGSGNGKVLIKETRINIYIPFRLVWKNNDAYLQIKDIHADYVPGEVLFSINDLDVGNEVNSEKISMYLKNNVNQFNITEAVINGMDKFVHAFFYNFVDNTPAKNFYTDNIDDLA